MKDIRCIAINREQRLAILDCGCTVNMQNFIDRFGDDTDDPHDAVSAIAPHDTRWVVIDLTDYEPVVRN